MPLVNFPVMCNKVFEVSSYREKEANMRSKMVKRIWSNSGIFYGYLGILLILMVGCAAPRVAPSGFLSNYDRLQPDPKDKDMQWWEKSDTPWQKYKRLILDPVETKIDRSKATREITQEEIDTLADHLRQTVVDAVQERYPVVTDSGVDVLRIRAALTHLKPVSGALNVLTTAAIFMPIDAGESAVEVQFIDSQSNEILGEVTISGRGGMMDVVHVWTRWSQVEATFKQWAKKLRDALDEATAVR